MARRTLPQVIPWPAPYNGVIRGTALADQPPRSAINALNARNRDPKDWRLRMCRRAGLSKWIADPVEGEDFEVQDIAFLNLNVNPAGVDLTIPGEPGDGGGPLGDPPLPFPPGDPIPDPEIPESEPEEPGDSEGEGPEQSFPEVSISEVSLSEDSSTPVSSLTSSEDGLSPCVGRCNVNAEVWLLISPSTTVTPYCLICVGSNDYGNVYESSYNVTYMDGELEINSLIFMRLEIVAVNDSYKWRLEMFLTNLGQPASEPEVRLETDAFSPEDFPVCPEDFNEDLRQFFDIIRDEESPLAVSTQAWSGSHDVRFEPGCEGESSSSSESSLSSEERVGCIEAYAKLMTMYIEVDA